MLDIKIIIPEVHSVPTNEVSENEWITKEFDMPLMYFDFYKNHLNIKK